MKSSSFRTILALLIFTAGCGGMFKGKAAAEQAVTKFHTLYNDGKVADIYAAGEAKFKAATTEKQFLDFMGAIQRKLGKVKSSENAGFNVQSFGRVAQSLIDLRRSAGMSAL